MNCGCKKLLLPSIRFFCIVLTKLINLYYPFSTTSLSVSMLKFHRSRTSEVALLMMTSTTLCSFPASSHSFVEKQAQKARHHEPIWSLKVQSNLLSIDCNKKPAKLTRKLRGQIGNKRFHLFVLSQQHREAIFLHLPETLLRVHPSVIQNTDLKIQKKIRQNSHNTEK